MPTTPPPDKQPAAETLEEIAERIEREYSVALSDEGKYGLFSAILSALLNERERAARVAEKHEGHGDWCSSAAGDCQSLTVKAVARAIREGK